jgi:hypothetical protein
MYFSFYSIGDVMKSMNCFPEIDPLLCPSCGGQMKIIAFIKAAEESGEYF